MSERVDRDIDTQAVAEELIRRRFIIDYRPPLGIRIAPHFYNTLDEVDAIMAEMQTIVEKKVPAKVIA